MGCGPIGSFPSSGIGAVIRAGSRPDLERIDRGLKDFQRLTVEHVFRRLYVDQPGTHRFLVADEVGLGKTVVARAVVARAIDMLWESGERIDVVYVCSNAAIARQNVARLKEGLGITSVPETDRLTLLPETIQQLDQQRVNLIAFTPGTSFDLSSSLGEARERVLLHRMLQRIWGISGTGAMNLLQGNVVNHHQWRQALRDNRPIEQSILSVFEQRVESAVELRRRFDDLCERFRYVRKPGRRPTADREHRNVMVGELRRHLAASCLQALQPDFIILDEFQRFRHLLRTDNPAGELAGELFGYSNATTRAKVLLLSATPYRMLTTPEEADEDHYVDFLDTLGFLSPDRVGNAERLFRGYRQALLNLRSIGSATETLIELKNAIENELRAVMVRTERLATAGDRGGMLREALVELVPTADDLRDYVGLEAVAASVKQAGALTYWKSAPYTLTFMDLYQLKSRVLGRIEDPEMRKSLDDCAFLDRNDLEGFQRTDPANARLRELEAQTLDSGAWKMLWMPPAAPYYELRGAYKGPGVRSVTKRLVFSGWQVVPKALSALLSYEAERRTMVASDPAARYRTGGEKEAQLLRFSRSAGRLTGLPVFALLYPSRVLARELDPLLLGRPEGSARRRTAQQVLRDAESRINELLETLPVPARSGRADERWYWVAPMLLDRVEDAMLAESWWGRADLAKVWTASDPDVEESGVFRDHVQAAREVALGSVADLGARPQDLARVLALAGLAAPATCALRSLSRTLPAGSVVERVAAMDAAASIAWGFRSMFNLPDAQATIRRGRRSRYWQQVLNYCLDGGLQAVLDEYVHLLREQRAPTDGAPYGTLNETGAEIRAALQLRTPTLSVDVLQDGGALEAVRIRTRFARRLASEEVEGAAVQKEGQIRGAFNSPFWPFVLISTSIGQEGLDFHPYCHAVVHWDLPSNPVDLEQREGRVHRYKGHAVRKNVAARHWTTLYTAGRPDPWDRLFDSAASARSPGDSDLIPYWIYLDGDHGAAIERHVLAYALSKDVARLHSLKRALVLYRLAFGQPRQQDLLDLLMESVPAAQAQEIVSMLRIDLAPPATSMIPAAS